MAWRLFLLVLAAAAIGLVIRELGRPRAVQPVDRAPSIDNFHPVQMAPGPAADPAQFRELLSLSGWNDDRFRALQEGEPLSDERRSELVDLLWRLRTFDGPQLAAWAMGNGLIRMDMQPVHAGELIELEGRVTKVARRELPADLAARYEMPDYYECEMTLRNDAGEATILTSRVPRAWLEMPGLDEPAATAGVFIRSLSKEAQPFRGLFVSREIAWNPVEPHAPYVSLGKSILGQLGVDVGQLDLITQRTSITAAESDIFYRLLGAAGRIGTNQLNRFARQQLPFISQRWAHEEKNLAEPAGDPARRQLAREVQARAAKGLYSVAPLFNDADNQVGELVSLVGTVRRVTPIDVDRSTRAAVPEDAHSFDTFRYYEIDLFTDDSQNNPIVVCIRELPPGFPIGDGLHEPVRVAGWFFKVWNFESRRATLPTAPDGSPTPPNLRQFAPLLIGRSPIPLEPPTASTTAYASYFAATLFIILLAAVWAAGWWIFRDDRRFSRTLARQYSLREGESLNDLQFDLREATRENE